MSPAPELFADEAMRGPAAADTFDGARRAIIAAQAAAFDAVTAYEDLIGSAGDAYTLAPSEDVTLAGAERLSSALRREVKVMDAEEMEAEDDEDLALDLEHCQVERDRIRRALTVAEDAVIGLWNAINHLRGLERAEMDRLREEAATA